MSGARRWPRSSQSGQRDQSLPKASSLRPLHPSGTDSIRWHQHLMLLPVILGILGLPNPVFSIEIRAAQTASKTRADPVSFDSSRRLALTAHESSLPYEGLVAAWPVFADDEDLTGMVLLEEIPATTSLVKASKVGAVGAAANLATAKSNSTAAGGQIPLPPRTGLHHWLHALKLMLSASFVLKCLCISSNVLYQVSPLPAARQFQKTGDTGEADSAPLVSIAFSCTQFFFYGSFAFFATGKSGFLVLVYSNAVGLALGYYYIYAFLAHCSDKQMASTTWTYLRCLACLFLGQFAFTYILPPGKALLMVGLISSTCTLISACSLVLTVPDVIRKRCSRSLPVPILMCGEVSAVLWLMCGYMLGDLYIILPNVVCVIITSLALFLAWYFPREVDDVDFGRFAVGAQEPEEEEGPRDYGSMTYSSTHHWAGSGSDHSPSPIARPTARRCSSSPHVYCAGTGEADGETGGTPSPPAQSPMDPESLSAYA
mmetsp:Transcript_6987/g.15935  ORF Transcript_6987/g.15935 Transcript_6987/m.15935 type:complete len:486 (-) Transcript_6987:452-1909(-)